MAREAERAPAPSLPAWRDPTGQGRDSLGHVLDEPSIATVVVRDGAVQREREALRHYPQGAYRDREAAQAALAEVMKQRGWYQAREEIAGDPTQFGELRGKVGWLVSAASKEERASAERVVQAVPDSLRRVHETESIARQGYVQSVQAQQVRDGTEIPGLSKAALAVLEGVREARLMAELPVKGEDYDVRKQRTEAAVSAVWHEGRADPRVASELDGFMAAVRQRLGEEGERAALRAASSGRSMGVPGVGREHQAGLNELARSFAQGRDGVTLSTAWGQRVEREAKEAERQRVRAEELGANHLHQLFGLSALAYRRICNWAKGYGTHMKSMVTIGKPDAVPAQKIIAQDVHAPIMNGNNRIMNVVIT